jgi:hypothetical protein
VTSPSAVPAFVDKLVSVFDAAVTVEVYDGPPITDAAKQAYVAVGWDGVDVDGGDAATFEQRLLYVGSVRKNETASVTCVAVSWSGGVDWSAERALVFGYVSACEQALRAAIVAHDPDLEGFEVYEVMTGSLAYERDPTDGNVSARVPFTVTYSTQI